MNGLNRREQFALNAAEGWLILGCPSEAEVELEAVLPENLSNPEVLCVRWALNYRRRRWTDASSIARLWCAIASDSLEAWIALANSIREAAGLERAKTILLDLRRRFPGEWVIPYNLACYCAQLGEITEALLWLNRALSLDPRQQVRREASTDPDLAPLWKTLAGDAHYQKEFCSVE